jgi:hypothetical protein
VCLFLGDPGSGTVAVGQAPFFYLFHHRGNCLAEGGEAVLHGGWYGGEDLSLDKSICLQLAELRRKHGRGDAGDLAFEDFKPFWLFLDEGVQDAQFPFTAQNAHGIFHRANNFFSFFCFFVGHYQQYYGFLY